MLGGAHLITVFRKHLNSVDLNLTKTECGTKRKILLQNVCPFCSVMSCSNRKQLFILAFPHLFFFLSSPSQLTVNAMKGPLKLHEADAQSAPPPGPPSPLT